MAVESRDEDEIVFGVRTADLERNAEYVYVSALRFVRAAEQQIEHGARLSEGDDVVDAFERLHDALAETGELNRRIEANIIEDA